jgi:hypothetical protein
MMRVDEARHHDAAARIDHVGAAGEQVGTDCLDPLALDQHVAAHEVADRRVHRHDGTAFDEIAPSRPSAVARRIVAVSRPRGTRIEQTEGRRGDRGRRRTFQETASRSEMVQPFLAQDAHVASPRFESFMTMTLPAFCHRTIGGTLRVETRIGKPTLRVGERDGAGPACPEVFTQS